MGYMIHFDEDAVGAEHLKLLETKKAILEKLRVRYGFDYRASSHTLAAAQTTPAKAVPVTYQPQPR